MRRSRSAEGSPVQCFALWEARGTEGVKVLPWLYCQVDLEVGFGEIRSVDLMPGGAHTGVTVANRQQYVELYMTVRTR